MTQQTTDPRQELYERLQWALAGYRTDDAVGALTDSLAAVVGFSADDLAHGEVLLNTLAHDAVDSMRRNWGYLCQMKAAAMAPPAGRA